ncbi:hypothetical protein LCGC14_0658540 [marine sediment metagenome]|uniref:Uncharacterized protein n=1 Tax=marine sediment metagenome TaxID=412755 RepID=A0A0F9TFU8_9ZZZZ
MGDVVNMLRISNDLLKNAWCLFDLKKFTKKESLIISNETLDS